jgi:hypothetical protein
MIPSDLKSAARGLAKNGELVVDNVLSRVGFRHSPERLEHDAADYWSTGEGSASWRSNSHWRGGTIDDSLWSSIGADHLDLWRMFAAAVGQKPERDRIVEWGVGGGANAVHFAPIAGEFVAVDVAQASLDECERQVRAVTSTPFVPVLVDVATPESAIASSPAPCDLFLCFYVLELVPTQDYGLRIVKIAEQMLADGGLAVIQTKYSTDRLETKSRNRRYTRHVANMTTYRIDEFWSAAKGCGLEPLLISLVTENALDERYAYYLLQKTRSL